MFPVMNAFPQTKKTKTPSENPNGKIDWGKPKATQTGNHRVKRGFY